MADIHLANATLEHTLNSMYPENQPVRTQDLAVPPQIINSYFPIAANLRVMAASARGLMAC